VKRFDQFQLSEVPVQQWTANFRYDGPKPPSSRTWKAVHIYDGPISNYVVFSYLQHDDAMFMSQTL